MFWQFILMLLIVYPIVLFFSILSEVTYRRRPVVDVRRDLRIIWRKATIIYAVFAVSSFLWFFVLKLPDEVTSDVFNKRVVEGFGEFVSWISSILIW